MIAVVYPNLVAVLYRVTAQGDKPAEATCGDAFHVRTTIDRWTRENPGLSVLGLSIVCGTEITP